MGDGVQRVLRRVLAVLAVLVSYYLIKYTTRILAIHPHFDWPAEWWIRAFDHHFIQLACALLAIGLLSRGRWQDWGLNLRNFDESLRILKRFVLIYGVYFIGIGFVLQALFVPAPEISESISSRSVAGKLAFGFLFVGVSEEILFRGLFHTFLALFWVGVLRIRSIEFPVAGLVAAIVFTVAHIGISFDPFSITHLSIPQLVMAFVLGLFYSWAYHRTGSLFAPIVAHNLSNGLLWVSEYTLVWLGT